MFVKDTKNQHYISVAEQKLNSINPCEKNRKKIKIYLFDLIDREKHLIRLSDQRLIKAEKNLCFTDLYTFEILDDNQRLCFENLFNRLERNIIEKTNIILDNNSYPMGDLLDVFKAKMLNMLRNPYCIEFNLNTYYPILNSYLTDTELLLNFNKINELIVPCEILNEFNVSEKMYKNWLKIIFLLITPLNRDKYILDDVAENFFNLNKYYLGINIFKYTDNACLLSDRSFLNLSELYKNLDGVCFGFNLRYDSFIYLSFIPNDLKKMAKEFLDESKENIAQLLLQLGVNKIQNNFEIRVHIDDIEMLKTYNKHVIYQCAKNVFSASENISI